MPASATSAGDEPQAVGESLIRFIRGQKVLLDADLAEVYGVATKVLTQAVRRNCQRFPHDFAFELSEAEIAKIEKSGKTVEISGPPRTKARKEIPLAFTEQGVAMVSSILSSKRAIEVNIEIMRSFVYSLPTACE